MTINRVNTIRDVPPKRWNAITRGSFYSREWFQNIEAAEGHRHRFNYFRATEGKKLVGAVSAFVPRENNDICRNSLHGRMRARIPSLPSCGSRPLIFYCLGASGKNFWSVKGFFPAIIQPLITAARALLSPEPVSALVFLFVRESEKEIVETLESSGLKQAAVPSWCRNICSSSTWARIAPNSIGSKSSTGATAPNLTSSTPANWDRHITSNRHKKMIGTKYLYLPFLLFNEWRPLPVLQRFQLRKLKRLVHHAYTHVPMYRNIYQKAGIHPDAIQSLEDITKLPIVDKRDFKQHPGCQCRSAVAPPPENLITVKTSGSSGQAFSFLIDFEYDQLRKAQFLRPYVTNGYSPFSRGVWFRVIPQEDKRWFQRIGLFHDHQLYSGANAIEQIRAICRLRPAFAKGYGSTLSLLASTAAEHGLPLPALRRAFTDSELLSAHSRHVIEEGFRTEVIDIYGTFETDNIAYECRRHEGYHMAIDCTIIEFIEGSRPVSSGTEGEIVCTVLDNLTTPFIRYNLHDIGLRLSQKCSCQRRFPLMQITKGRSSDFALVNGGAKISATTISGQFRPFADKLHEFQVIQEAIDGFRVLVVPRHAYRDQLTQLIHQGMHALFPHARIKVEMVKTITRNPSGKLMCFQPLTAKRDTKGSHGDG